MGVSNFFICDVASYFMRALVCVGEVDTSHLNFVHCGLVFSSHGLVGVCELHFRCVFVCAYHMWLFELIQSL